MENENYTETTTNNENFTEETDNNKSELGEFKDTAAIFGMTESELFDEYKEYKALKLFRRTACDLTCITGDGELFDKLDEIVKLKIGKIIVLPQYVKKVNEKLRGKDVEIIGAICFPYGEEIPYINAKSAKKVVLAGADKVLAPVGASAIKRGNTDLIRKQFKKILNAVKDKEVCALLECNVLTKAELERTVKLLKEVGIKSFCSGSGFFKPSEEFSDVVDLRSSGGTKANVFGYADNTEEIGVLGLYKVSDVVITKKAVEIARYIRQKLNI